MKIIPPTLGIALMGTVMSGSAAAAALPLAGYDHVYDPISGESPSVVATPWTLSGADPLSSVSGEIATMTTTNGPNNGFWGRFAGDGVDLDGDGYTLDFRVDPISDPGTGFFLSIVLDDPDDTGSMIEVRIRESDGNHVISVQEEGGGNRGLGSVALDDGFHTYRFTRLGDNFSVYVDANPAPVLTGTIANAFSGGAERVLFGDIGGSIVGEGSIDWIALDQDAANFSAPIPEPASMALLLAGGLLVTRRWRA